MVISSIEKRKKVYIIVSGLLVILFLMLRDTKWKGSTQLHTNMEIISFVLAFMVGIQAIIRYKARETVVLLFVGMGFLGAGMLDAYHAVVTSSYFRTIFPSPPPSLIPWSWVASRLFLGVFLYLAYFIWRNKLTAKDCFFIKENVVYVTSLFLTIGCFAFFALYPLPRAYYPEYLFHRPEEFIPALFFALALYGFLDKGGWKTDVFEHWLIISLIVGLISQALFMPLSGSLFDMEFDAAHLLKSVSYICVLLGLFISMSHIFQSEEKNRLRIQKAYDDLKSSQRQLMQSERLSSLGQMVAGIAHEINTPLGTAVTNISELEDRTLAFRNKLKRGISRDDMEGFLTHSQDFTQMARENLLRAAELVRSFKMVAVDQSSEEERQFNLKEHIKSTLTTLHHEFKRTDINIELKCPDNLLITSYPGAYSQIISNLIHNSLIHGFDNGNKSGKIMLSVIYEENKEQITVNYTDNGKGLNNEQKLKIFDPFFTSRRNQGGSGLGMHIVHNLITELLQGTIKIEEDAPRGIHFHIVLPNQINVKHGVIK